MQLLRLGGEAWGRGVEAIGEALRILEKDHKERKENELI